MKANSGCRGVWRHAVIALSAFLMLSFADPASAGSDDAALDWSEAYAGVFASFGRTDNRIVPDPISWMV